MMKTWFSRAILFVAFNARFYAKETKTQHNSYYFLSFFRVLGSSFFRVFFEFEFLAGSGFDFFRVFFELEFLARSGF